MSTVEFAEATRVATNPLAGLERRCLIWMAGRLPRWVTSDGLTALALAAMAITGISYARGPGHPGALLIAIVGLALNWFGDSLDGTVARVRRQQRPRYGFYVDHVVDCLGAFLLLGGLALSTYMTPAIATGLLVVFLMLSIESYLATYTLGTFHISYWKFSPTELRILLAAGNVALFYKPVVKLFGAQYRLFDVGGAAGIVGMGLMLIVSVAQHTVALYRAETNR